VTELSATGARALATAVVDGVVVLVVADGDSVAVWALATCSPGG
jgi:hypothetical protein